MVMADRNASRMRRSTTADQIKQLILTRDLKPGDLLPTEAELCETLGVSRSSVREAMRTLATLDIVEVRYGHGTFVGGMSLDPMVEALVFRGVLSPTARWRPYARSSRCASPWISLSPSWSSSGPMRARRMPTPFGPGRRDGAARRAWRELPRGGRAFHTKLFAATGNRLGEQLVGAFWDVHTAVIPLLEIPMPDDIRRRPSRRGDARRRTRGRRRGLPPRGRGPLRTTPALAGCGGFSTLSDSRRGDDLRARHDRRPGARQRGDERRVHGRSVDVGSAVRQVGCGARVAITDTS